jgi:hypothetical protein
MPLPNFLIIGAAKAGTTSLYHYLQQHPQIYMSPLKEPRFFALEGKMIDRADPINRKSIVCLEDYRQLFDGVTRETAIGEASPMYLASPVAAERIHHYLPEVKLIAILRHPVARAYSHFIYMIQKNIEPTTNFMQALAQPDYRLGSFVRTRPYIDYGFYHSQLQRYFRLFRSEQINVFLYDDLQTSSTRLLRQLFQFLEVDDTFLPDLRPHNASGLPKNRVLHQLLYKSQAIRAALKPLVPVGLRQTIAKQMQTQKTAYPPIPAEAKTYLLQLYRDDILQLQDLLDRDLSHWLHPS